MKKILFLIMFLFLCSTAQAATTYYARVSGGTSTQCTGTTNADYSGSGTAQACAFNHPAWALGATGTSGRMVGGDTLVIDDTSSAQYMVGYGMPNTSGCTPFGPVDCFMGIPPSGTDTAHPTRILGSSYASGCATKPQLYGTQSVKQVLKLQSSSYIDIECIEITDHSNCGFRVGPNQCSENYSTGQSVGVYGREGIAGDGVVNLTLKNMDIHGMSDRGILLGDLSGITTISHVNVDGNYQAGWDGDSRSVYGGTGAINVGTWVGDYLKTRFNGYMEAYPRSASFSAGDYSNAVDQNSNPPGYGDGISTYDASGTFTLTHSDISHNAQDGWDLLYCPNNCTFNGDENTFEGNDGNQFKQSGKIINFTNSVVIGNCNYAAQANKTAYPSQWTSCRAGGDAISLTVVAGSIYKFTNNTIVNYGGNSAFLFNSRYGTCNGTEAYTFKNNVNYSSSSVSLYLNSSLSGACATPFNNIATDHSDVFGFNATPSGTGNTSSDPLFTSPISVSAASNIAAIYLLSGSPAKGTAADTTVWNLKRDINNFPWNGSIDMGGVAFGSSAQLAQAGQTCVATTDCATGTCSSGVCSGSCTNNGGACSTGATCCSGACTASVCAIPATCGDGVIQPGEVCDGSNLGNQSCLSQSFTGGSLSCASDCKSFVTSSCTNTTVFPLTPILDTFTRANSTGLGTNWTLLTGRMDISSNAALPTTHGGFDAYYWTPSAFVADEEAYATISAVGSDQDSLELHVRYTPATQTSYYVVALPATSLILLFRSNSINHSSEVQLGANINQAISSGDSIGISVVGSTVTAWYKSGAGAWTNVGARTDTTYTAGGNVVIGSFGVGGGTPSIKFTNNGGGSINPITCGNGLKESGEICDGADLASQTCITQGYASGTLTCATNCQSFVTSSCVTASTCGNNTKESGEVCDGTDIASQTCVGLGYLGGSLSCAGDCKSFVTTSCVTSSSGVRGGLTIK